MTNFKVGVIGGGQLVHMMSVPASTLNIDLNVLIESKGVSADKVFPHTCVANADDYQKVLDFAKSNHVITFEHEHVPQNIIQALEDAGKLVFPSSSALQFAQNKILMRQKMDELGMPNPDYIVANDIADIQRFLLTHNGNIVIKLPVGGYDGKGVLVVEGNDLDIDLINKWFKISDQLLIEEKVDFRREIAGLCARSRFIDNGEPQIKVWDASEVISQNSVCKTVISPARQTDDSDGLTDLNMQNTVKEVCLRIAKSLDIIGVLAVEMFEKSDGNVIINELALRPHNTGHWTIDGAVTSQFENHLRAVLGLPLGSTEAKSSTEYTVMENILGSQLNSLESKIEDVMKIDDSLKINLYNKSIKPGRKLGHINYCDSDYKKAMQIVKAAANLFEGNGG